MTIKSVKFSEFYNFACFLSLQNLDNRIIDGVRHIHHVRPSQPGTQSNTDLNSYLKHKLETHLRVQTNASLGSFKEMQVRFLPEQTFEIKEAQHSVSKL